MTDHVPTPRAATLPRRAVLAAGAALPLIGMAGPGWAAKYNELMKMRVIESGHSLTDPIVPVLNAMLATLGVPKPRPDHVIKSTIPGSPMEWRWNNRVEYGPDARYDIAEFDLLVITERVSLANTVPYHHSEDMALLFFENAWKNGRGGKGAPTILYGTWVEWNSGPDFPNPYKDPEAHLTFRERMPLEMTRWQQIADSVNARRPDGSPEMRVIPGPMIMAAVYDAIAAGTAPGLTKIDDLFRDDIHLNDSGAYLIALSHLAVIYDFDPRGLTGGIGGGEPRNRETSKWMRQLVHDVLLTYPQSGYTGGS